MDNNIICIHDSIIKYNKLESVVINDVPFVDIYTEYGKIQLPYVIYNKIVTGTYNSNDFDIKVNMNDIKDVNYTNSDWINTYKADRIKQLKNEQIIYIGCDILSCDLVDGNDNILINDIHKLDKETSETISKTTPDGIVVKTLDGDYLCVAEKEPELINKPNESKIFESTKNTTDLPDIISTLTTSVKSFQ